MPDELKLIRGFSVEVPIQTFRALMHVMTRDESRTAIHGVILSWSSNALHLVGTDGRIIAVFTQPTTGGPTHQDIVIPRESIELLLRCAKGRMPKVVVIERTEEDPHAVTLKPIGVPGASSLAFRVSYIKGSVNWRGVFPKNPVRKMGASPTVLLGTGYLSNLLAMFEELDVGGSANGMTLTQLEGYEGLHFSFLATREVQGLIMPVRDLGSGDDVITFPW